MRKIVNLNKDDLIELFNKHDSIRQVLIDLGYDSNGSGAYTLLRNKCIKEGVTIPKYIKKVNNQENFINKKQYSEILCENSTFPRGHLKKRLLKDGLLDYKCDVCGISKWRNKSISLHLDHINGVNNDNRLENLRLLCPNCHTQTKTYGGRNNKKTYYCECGVKIHKNSEKCVKCNTKLQRIVNRPSYEQLVNEIEEIGYCGVGRKYGVSDNAIRKWKKQYEKYKEDR